MQIFKRFAQPLVLVAVVFGVGLLSGCKSKTEKAGDTMKDQAMSFRDSLDRMPAQIDEVQRRALAAGAGQNPNRADDIREFNKSVATLRDNARVVASEANAAEVDANKYFTAWAKQAQKTNAADRPAVRAEAKASREQVNTALGYLERARDKFNTLMGSLDKVQSGLAKDQSEAGIVALQPDVAKIVSQSMDARNYIDRLKETIDAALATK